jgi:hypothetical protein
MIGQALGLCSCIALWPLLMGPADEQPALRKILAAQRRLESTLGTIACEYEYRTVGTSDEMVSLLRERARLEGAKNIEKWITSAAAAQASSYRVKLWRHGQKERMELFPLDSGGDAVPTAIIVFDGQTHRAVSTGASGAATAAIKSAETADWHTLDRLTPLSFLYAFNRPYSAFLEAPRDLTGKTDAAPGPRSVVFSFRDPENDTHGYELSFNEKEQLCERKVLAQIGDPKPRLYRTLVMTDFRLFEAGTEGHVDVPFALAEHYYVGTDAQGRLLQSRTVNIAVRSFVVNPRLPSDCFVLRFPAHTAVDDGLSGLGWLEPGHRPAHLFPEEQFPWRKLWLAILVAIVLFGAAWILWRNRRLTAAKA